jgi:thymidylate synthase (FAD)
MRCDPDSYDIKGGHTTDVKSHKENIACFRIKVPMFVARQFMRHRSFSYLEMSRRYTKGAKVPFEFWFPKGFQSIHKEMHTRTFIEAMDNASDYYKLETQVASRFLPQTTYTEFYAMGEVEGLKNFFTLRCAKEAQSEIREVAMAMLKLIASYQIELYHKVLP